MNIFKDDGGEITAITTGIADETPPANLAYLRPSPHARRFPAEVYLKIGETDHFAVAINRNQLMNILEMGTRLLRDFDRRPVEDLEVE